MGAGRDMVIDNFALCLSSFFKIISKVGLCD
jgi:hypothetical protein